jgi:hypothetical protein
MPKRARIFRSARERCCRDVRTVAPGLHGRTEDRVGHAIGRGARVVLLASVAGALAAPAVFAALHNAQDFSHGIVSTPGYNCNTVNQYCRSWIHDVDGTSSNADLHSGMYHRRADGGWNQQQLNSCVNCTSMQADGPSGTEPCRKYAWTQGTDPSSVSSWHGLNTEACGGNHIS